MCHENVGKRRALSLDKHLQASLDQGCALRKHVDQPKLPSPDGGGSGFRVKPCFGFGVCVCAEHTQGMFLFQKLAAYMRRVCWKSKDKDTKKVTMSAARRVLEDSRMVLQLSAGVLLDAKLSSLEDHLLSGGSDEPSPGTQVIVRFLHIGRIHLTSFHFAGTEVVRADTVPGVHDENVLYVRFTGRDEDFKTDMQVFLGCTVCLTSRY